jgi:hypothetical protein
MSLRRGLPRDDVIVAVTYTVEPLSAACGSDVCVLRMVIMSRSESLLGNSMVLATKPWDPPRNVQPD